MKKILLIIAVILFIIMGLGISFKKKNEPQNQLVFWTLQLGTFSDYIQPIINNFEKTHPGIKILWVDIPYSEGGKRTLAAILSDNPPDLINATPEFTTLLAQKNTLATFEKKDIEQYLPSIMKGLSLDNGKSYYALPFYSTTAITIYNKELAQKAGIKTLPKTYEQMYSYGEEALSRANAYITMPTINENDTFLKILNKYNLASSEKINSQKAEDLVNEYKELYKKEVIPKEALTQTHRESLEKYMSGQIVFYNGGANFINLIKENAPDVYNKTDITYQITGTNGKYDFSLMDFIIPKNSKHKELALEFAKYLTNRENQLQFAKLTTVMPVNKETLEDDFFKSSRTDDLISKARYISAFQLKNVLEPVKIKNQKGLTEILNKNIAEIILEKTETKNGLNNISKWWADKEN